MLLRTLCPACFIDKKNLTPHKVRLHARVSITSELTRGPNESSNIESSVLELKRYRTDFYNDAIEATDTGHTRLERHPSEGCHAIFLAEVHP